MVTIKYEKKTRFLLFQKIETNLYYIYSRKMHDLLGYITLFRPWKRFVFNPENNEFVFDAECLQDIIDFMNGLKEA